MRAMVLEEVGTALALRDVPKPKSGSGQLLVRVSACAVCRTDLHIVDGELPDPKLPLILGHQIVGRVEEIPSSFGIRASSFAVGDRVGAAVEAVRDRPDLHQDRQADAAMHVRAGEVRLLSFP